MITKHAKEIAKFFKIYLSIFTVLLGAAFIFCICFIFFTGPLQNSDSLRPYTFTAELVGEYLKYLSIPLAIYIVSIILASIFFYYFPEKKDIFVKSRPINFLRRVKSYDLIQIEDPKNKKLLKRNKLIRIITYITTGLVIFTCLFVSIWYLKDKNDYYVSDPLGAATKLFLEVLPFAILSLSWGIGAVFVIDITAKQDISILKNEKLFTLDKKLKTVINPKTENIIINIGRVIIGVTAITFIVLGVFNDGMRDVFIKAVNICTECIGLG